MLQSKKGSPAAAETRVSGKEPEIQNPDPPHQAIPESHEVFPGENDESFNATLPPLGELKFPIIKALREERHSLAAAMEKSEHWKIDGQILSLTFSNPFESTFIEKECREIERIIKSSLGWDIKIKTVINEKNDTSSDEELEEQVELVRNVFRGTIVNRS